MKKLFICLFLLFTISTSFADTVTYTGPVALSDVSASLPVFTDANKKLVTKTVAETKTALGLTSALVYKGAIDCATNPNYPAADAGHVYVVSVAGKIGGASGADVYAGDSLLCKVDSSAAGTQAAVGANWDILEANSGLVLLPQTTGFTIAGGTTSKTLTVAGDVSVGQAFTTPAFSAGDFAANGSMTWTVESGDVSTYAYITEGKRMTILFQIVTSTVGGTPSNRLKIKIPDGKTATKGVYLPCVVVDNGTLTIGFCAVYAGDTYIYIGQLSGNFSASTNNTEVYGEIVIEIN